MQVRTVEIKGLEGPTQVRPPARGRVLGRSWRIGWMPFLLAALVTGIPVTGAGGSESTSSVTGPALVPFASAPAVVAGRLEERDLLLPDGRFADTYDLPLSLGDRIELGLRPTGFDGVLQLLDPRGDVVAEADDGGPDEPERLTARAEEEGLHRVRVTSYHAGATGRYRLEARAEPGRWPPGESRTDDSWLRTGETVEGELGPGAPGLAGGGWYREYRLQAEAGEAISLRVVAAFDPLVLVVAPSGAWVGRLAGVAGQSFVLTWKAEESGEHRVWVSSGRPGASGAYRLERR
ncbi:hypothetical protein [Limnochorda pilosa]|uniref:Peptidase C-terminal archaeal/bacterial domain-containing protein n=1 Tax=Limnochorda pilosa TaxID=1555112 RepID=A0A0K2SHL3_LIMPI|nr:hypothetical protein [Limnochorda pilosa]BAS26606.1 hypothetical protein LIP_0749 [Limnochorda pilosa]